LALKSQKNVASKATNTAAGKALFNKFVDKETKNMIKSITTIISHTDSEEKAKQTKSDVFRLAVKLILLYQDKLISKEDFDLLKGKFRMVCSSLKNGYRFGVLEEATAIRIELNIVELCTSVRELVTGFLSEHTLMRLERLNQTLANKDWLLRASCFQEEFGEIIIACAHYLEQMR